MLYPRFIRPLLYAIDAERAHHLAFGLLRLAMWIPGVPVLLSRLLAARSTPTLRTEALGRTFPHPVGLAAGFDKDAVGYHALGTLGFAFVEVGTLTGQGQTGNPKPRLFRLPRDRALLNRMGFNNGGSAGAVARLAGPREVIVGVNIGKTKVVSEADAAEDYALSTERLAKLADYFVVNVSSPNTPGLRDLQAVDKLRPLLRAVQGAMPERDAPPLLVKIAPDLADEDIDAVADLALELGLDGIIATNTTISREGLATAPAEVTRLGNGGLSGAPLRRRSLDVLRRLRRRLGPEMLLVSVGGIDSAEVAWERIRAGATLVQIYTAFVYEGPGLPGRVAKGLSRLARRDGFRRVQDAVGIDA